MSYLTVIHKSSDYDRNVVGVIFAHYKQKFGASVFFLLIQLTSGNNTNVINKAGCYWKRMTQFLNLRLMYQKVHLT